MKRMHIHVAVRNVGEAIPFYSTLFATKPCVVKPDYAKWMLAACRTGFGDRGAMAAPCGGVATSG